MAMNNRFRYLLLAFSLSGICLGLDSAMAQNPAPGKTEATIGMAYFKKSDLSKMVVAVVKRKDAEGKFVPARSAPVNFYTRSQNETRLLKRVSTDNKGQAMMAVPGDLPLDDSLYFTLIAKIENDSLYQDVQEQIHYKDVSLALSIDPKDTARMATAKLLETSKDGKAVPVKGAEVKFYIRRMFGYMAASEENTVSTDEKGEAVFSYPRDIPGDTSGNITLVARLEDNEKFGNVEIKSSQNWGTTLVKIEDPFPRALWDYAAPFPLVITISTLFGGVWLVYFFIFYQLRKIKKEGQQALKGNAT
jgi:hypothetical protein